MRTPRVQASAPPAPPAPPAPKAPAAPQGFSMGGGLGGGLFDKLKALVEPVDVGGGSSSSSAPKAKADAIYEDDEMSGGMGTKKVGSPNVPFRPTFKKEDDK